MLRIEGSTITTELGVLQSLGAVVALERAERIAIRRGDLTVATTHLLRALVSGDCVGFDRLSLLESCGGKRDVEMVGLLYLVHFLPEIRIPRLDFTPELYRTFKTAACEATQNELGYLYSDHLLRAIALNTGCEANSVLAKLGVDRERLAQAAAPPELKLKWGYTYSPKKDVLDKFERVLTGPGSN
ncbi:MAG: Clp protease N-terminal domain-containing protein [Candidatus Daviesbacteria bacterium]|nr:Clp protease N-terminal domain-containing protein [Candidatus Daviesbacteria bacterium]